MSAEIPLQNPSVFRSIENCAPGFQFADPSRRFTRVQLGHAPIVDVLTASHGIGEVDFPIVSIVHIREGGRNATFCHDRVRFAKERFAN